jgi:MoxR-like ATPase
MKAERRKFLRLATGAAVIPALPRVARAQTYPTRPVRVVVGYAAGGSTDIMARLIGQSLSERLGQQFAVANDLLFEIERMEFALPELRTHVVGDPARRPIVVITSNTEKTLPEPFLRRCVFHHIKAPDAARRLEIIIKRRHPFIGREPLFKQAMAFFEQLQERLGRAPGTAELLAWLDMLDGVVKRAEAGPGSAKVENLRGRLRPSLGILAKTEDDLRTITEQLGPAGLD